MAATHPTRTVGYDDFGTWYDGYRARVLEPALQAAWASLDEALDDVLSDRDLARIRKSQGRVKSKRRTWRKLRQPRYAERLGSVDDIPDLIDDLVGLRITCTNLRDIEMVQGALDTLPRRPGGSGGLWLDPATERDYVIEPKESGYRGWHANLGLEVEVDGVAVPVVCELQVRTLLQDSWGELTHEDTYSKAGSLPPLVEVLSKRMADLFATLDDIAEDLRVELDRLDEAAVAEGDDLDRVPPAMEDGSAEQAADAAAVLADRWRRLDRPTDLASLAWALQREFGAEISDDWFGHRSFKAFLRHAVPAGEISTGRQAYLLPAGHAPEADEVDDADDVDDEDEAPAAPAPDDEPDDSAPSDHTTRTIPAAAERLRHVDRGFPLLESEQWPALYEHLAEAWRALGPREPSTRVVNQLTRSARDRADAAGKSISRRHLDYVAKAVLFADEERQQPMDATEIGELFATLTLQRMADLRLLGPKSRRGRAAVRRWLRGV